MTPPTRESRVPTEPGWYLANVRKRENEDESDLWLNDPMEKVWVHWQPDAEFPVQVPGNGFTADWVIEWGPSLAELLAKAERTDAAEAELLAARSAKPMLDVLRGLSPQDAAALAEMLEDDSMRGAMRGALLRQALGNAEHRYYVVSEGWVDSLRIVELADEIQGAGPSDLDEEPRHQTSVASTKAPAAPAPAEEWRPTEAEIATLHANIRRKVVAICDDLGYGCVISEAAAAWSERSESQIGPWMRSFVSTMWPAPVDLAIVGRLAAYVERCEAECGHDEWAAAYSSLALGLRQIESGEATLDDGPLGRALADVAQPASSGLDDNTISNAEGGEQPATEHPSGHADETSSVASAKVATAAPAPAEETSVGRPDRADGKPGTPERCIDCRHFWARRGLCAHKSLCPNNEPGTPCGNPGDGRPAWCPVAPSEPLDEFAENRWRKKPVVITARRMRAPFGVHTLEGHVHGQAGDWCITGVEGESYPCADRIFRATYERADEPAAPPVAWVDGRATVGGFVLVHERMTRSHTVACLDDEGIGFVVRFRDEATAKRGAIAVARAMGGGT